MLGTIYHLKGKELSYFDIIEGNSPCTGDIRTLLSLGFDNLVISDSSILELENTRKFHECFS